MQKQTWSVTSWRLQSNARDRNQITTDMDMKLNCEKCLAMCYESINLQWLPHVGMRVCKALWPEGSVLAVSDVSRLRCGELIPLIKKKHLLLKIIHMRLEVWWLIWKAGVCIWNKGLEVRGVSMQQRIRSQDKRTRAAKCYAGKEKEFTLDRVRLYRALKARLKALGTNSKGWGFPKLVDLTSPG